MNLEIVIPINQLVDFASPELADAIPSNVLVRVEILIPIDRVHD